MSKGRDPGRRWMTQGEVAEYLSVTVRTVRNMIIQGRLRACSERSPRLWLETF